MMMNGTSPGPGGGSPLTLFAEALEPATGFADSTLASAATAMARAQDEIDDLWRRAVRVDDEPLSDRLVDVSHALQRAARLLEEERAIG